MSEPTDAEIEAGARALCQLADGRDPDFVPGINDFLSGGLAAPLWWKYRGQARAVLQAAAARSPAPLTEPGELLPCPFCGEELKHVESLAQSFDPPRVYHEYHHPENDCFLYRSKHVMGSFTEEPWRRLDWIAAWNRRAPQPEPDAARIRDEAQAVVDAALNWRASQYEMTRELDEAVAAT